MSGRSAVSLAHTAGDELCYTVTVCNSEIFVTDLRRNCTIKANLPFATDYKPIFNNGKWAFFSSSVPHLEFVPGMVMIDFLFVQLIGRHIGFFKGRCHVFQISSYTQPSKRLMQFTKLNRRPEAALTYRSLSLHRISYFQGLFNFRGHSQYAPQI